MTDIIENIAGSVIQHGLHNNRIYLMRLNTADTHSLIAMLDDMAIKNCYGKIFAKIQAPEWNAFQSAGYIKEAVIPGFFTGKTDGLFIAKFFSAKKQKKQDDNKSLSLVKPLGNGSANNTHRTAGATREIVSCKPSDAKEMSMIYQKVFKSYPFPIQDPIYLKRIMKEGALYFCIRNKGRIAAISAAEIDAVNKNAEMTDFATLPKCRGMGFAAMLLRHMDKKARKLGIRTAYTIARAASHGMNLVFKKSGYSYAGLLKNNTQICGSIENMTVWYKHL